MKLKKIITMGIASIMAVSAISIPVLADTGGDAVYMLEGDNGETIVYTQSDIDSGHWNTDALGKSSPYVYEDFPVFVDYGVDDYGNLDLYVSYMKTLSDGDTAQIILTDISDGSIFYQGNLTDKILAIENVDINKTYIITVSESFGGAAAVEYSKAIVTSYTQAKMPEYVADASVANERNTISIADTDNLALSELTGINEKLNPNVERYTVLSVDEFTEYCNNLAENKIYRVMTAEGVGNVFSGFISTYSWGKNLGIYNPVYTLCEVEDINRPMTLASPTLTSSIVQSKAEEITRFIDHAFSTTSSTPYKIYSFKTSRDFDPELDTFNLVMSTSATFTLEMWYKPDGGSVAYCSDVTKNLSHNQRMESLLWDKYGDRLIAGDTVYFVLYPTTASAMDGTFYFDDEYYMTSKIDDVSGSAWKLFKENKSVAADEVERTYNISFPQDGDCFYFSDVQRTDVTYVFFCKNQSDVPMRMSLYENIDADYGVIIPKLIDEITIKAGRSSDVCIFKPNMYYHYFMNISSTSSSFSGNKPYTYSLTADENY